MVSMMADEVKAMTDWELTTYREKIEDLLAHAEVPKYYLPRERLQSNWQLSWRSRTREVA